MKMLPELQPCGIMLHLPDGSSVNLDNLEWNCSEKPLWVVDPCKTSSISKPIVIEGKISSGGAFDYFWKHACKLSEPKRNVYIKRLPGGRRQVRKRRVIFKEYRFYSSLPGGPFTLEGNADVKCWLRLDGAGHEDH